MLAFTYGKGKYIHPEAQTEGEIILNEHKLYLKSDKGEELAQTFTPLDKIQRMTRSDNRLRFHIRLTVSFQYDVQFIGEKKRIKELAQDIAKSCGLKKAFWKDEWVGQPK